MAQQKCAHPPCTCMVKDSPYGAYCSEYCQLAGDTVVEVFCECRHDGCDGTHP